MSAPVEPSASQLSAPRLLLTVEEAAERLGVGRTTTYGLVKIGAIRSVTIGRLRRIPLDALDDYVHDLSRKSGAA